MNKLVLYINGNLDVKSYIFDSKKLLEDGFHAKYNKNIYLNIEHYWFDVINRFTLFVTNHHFGLENEIYILVSKNNQSLRHAIFNCPNKLVINQYIYDIITLPNDQYYLTQIESMLLPLIF